jgi:hypothetical protein
MEGFISSRVPQPESHSESGRSRTKCLCPPRENERASSVAVTTHLGRSAAAPGPGLPTGRASCLRGRVLILAAAEAGRRSTKHAPDAREEQRRQWRWQWQQRRQLRREGARSGSAGAGCEGAKRMTPPGSARQESFCPLPNEAN